MRRSSQEERRRATLARALVACTTIAALASALWGLKSALPLLNDTRSYWSATPARIRDDPVPTLYGFGDRRWDRLAQSIGMGDRYAVVAEGDGQHEIRNYAAYRLLPAIQVRAPAEANVVVFYEVGGSPADCLPVAKGVCVVRRDT
jgi:hypothetical protein